MSMFGWSYPPGCSGTPYDDDDMCPESEQAWEILEKEGVNEEIIEQITNIIDDLYIKSNQECPRCLEEYAREMQNFEDFPNISG